LPDPQTKELSEASISSENGQEKPRRADIHSSMPASETASQVELLVVRESHEFGEKGALNGGQQPLTL